MYMLVTTDTHMRVYIPAHFSASSAALLELRALQFILLVGLNVTLYTATSLDLKPTVRMYIR